MLAGELSVCEAFMRKAYPPPQSIRILPSPEPSPERFDDKLGRQEVSTVIWGRVEMKSSQGTEEAPFVCFLENSNKAVGFLTVPSYINTPSGPGPDPLMTCANRGGGTLDACLAGRLNDAQKVLDSAVAMAHTRTVAVDRKSGMNHATKALDDAQSAWANYRAASCAVIRIKNEALAAAPTYERACLIQETLRRAAELNGLQ